jgi:hypothetical protein
MKYTINKKSKNLIYKNNSNILLEILKALSDQTEAMRKIVLLFYN